MTDHQISDLFAEGTAPERDPDFVRSVAARVGRARLSSRILALALRATGVLVLSGALYVAAGVVRPVFAQLLDGSSQFMGVPMPVALSALVAGLALGARRHVLTR